MTPNRELKLAYRLAATMFVVGVFCYAAFSAPTPDTPVRIMFQNAGGKVLFSHKIHTDDAGYALACADCHHTLDEGETEVSETCGECHEPESDDEDVPFRKKAFHDQCQGCHEGFGAGPDTGPEACAICHVR